MHKGTHTCMHSVTPSDLLTSSHVIGFTINQKRNRVHTWWHHVSTCTLERSVSFSVGFEGKVVSSFVSSCDGVQINERERKLLEQVSLLVDGCSSKTNFKQVHSEH